MDSSEDEEAWRLMREAKEDLENLVSSIQDLAADADKDALKDALPDDFFGEFFAAGFSETFAEIVNDFAWVLSAIEANSGVLDRADGYDSVYRMLQSVLLVGMVNGSADKSAVWKEKQVSRLMAAKLANSKSVDREIAALAEPVQQRHPAWTPHRVAGQIEEALNERLAGQRRPPLALDAIRKRVKKLRTNDRSSG
jgi:hypothetical protein